MESASAQVHTFIQRHGWKKMLLLSFKTISNSTTSMRSSSLVIVSPTDCSGQGPSHLICLEPTEAFNTVYHDILLTHLRSITGLSESVLGWFQSYLSGKMEYISLEDAKSCVLLVTCGVPEGSVVSPILYILYILYISGVISCHGLSAILKTHS